MRKVAALALSFVFAANSAIAENRKEAMSLQGVPRSPIQAPGKMHPQGNKEHYESSYPHTHWQKALYFKQKGDLDNALIEFLKTTQENPQKVQAFYEQALIFRQRGYQKLAKSALEQALAVKPDFSQARMLLAAFYLEKGDIQGAFGQLSKSLGIADLSQVPKLQPVPPVREPSVIQMPHGPLPETPEPAAGNSYNSSNQSNNSAGSHIGSAPNTVSPVRQQKIVKATAQEASNSLDELLRGIPGIDPSVPSISNGPSDSNDPNGKTADQGLGLSETADQILASANSSQAQNDAQAQAVTPQAKPAGDGPLAFLDPLLKPLLNPLSVFGVKPNDNNKSDGWFGWFKGPPAPAEQNTQAHVAGEAQEQDPNQDNGTIPNSELLANSPVPENQPANNDNAVSTEDEPQIINETAVLEEQTHNSQIANDTLEAPDSVPASDAASGQRSLPTPIRVAMVPATTPSPSNISQGRMTGAWSPVPLPQASRNQPPSELPIPTRHQRSVLDQRQPGPDATGLETNSLETLPGDTRQQRDRRQKGLSIKAQPNLSSRQEIAMAGPGIVNSPTNGSAPPSPGVVKSTSGSFSIFGFDIIPTLPKLFHKQTPDGPRPVRMNRPVEGDVPPEPKLARSHRRGTFTFIPTSRSADVSRQPLPVKRNASGAQLIAQANPNALSTNKGNELSQLQSRGSQRPMPVSPLPAPYLGQAKESINHPNIVTPSQISRSEVDYASPPLIKNTTSESSISPDDISPSAGTRSQEKIAFVQQGPSPIRTASKQPLTTTPTPATKQSKKRSLFSFLPSMPSFNFSQPVPQARNTTATQPTPNPTSATLHRASANLNSQPKTAGSSIGSRHQPLPIQMRAEVKQFDVKPLNSKQATNESIFAPLIKATSDNLNLPELVPSQPPTQSRVAFNHSGPQPVHLNTKSSGIIPAPLSLNIANARRRSTLPALAPSPSNINAQAPQPHRLNYTPDQTTPQPAASLGVSTYTPSSVPTDRNAGFVTRPEPVIAKHNIEQSNGPGIKRLASMPAVVLPDINPLLPNTGPSEDLDIKPSSSYKVPKLAFSASGPTPVRFTPRNNSTTPTPLSAQAKQTNTFSFTPQQSRSTIGQSIPQTAVRQNYNNQAPQPVAGALNQAQFIPSSATRTNQLQSFAQPAPVTKTRSEQSNPPLRQPMTRTAAPLAPLPNIAPLLSNNQTPAQELDIKPSYSPPKVAFASSGPTPVRLASPSYNTMPQPLPSQARQSANTFNFKPQSSQNPELRPLPQTNTRRTTNNQQQGPQPNLNALDKTLFSPTNSGAVDQYQSFNAPTPVMSGNLPEQSAPVPQLKLRAIAPPTMVQPIQGQFSQTQMPLEGLSIKPSTGQSVKSTAKTSAKPPATVHGPGELANMFFPNWFKVAPVNAKLNVPQIVKPAQPVKPVNEPKQQIATNNTDEADDFWTRKLKYIKAHGTANLGPGEAFLFSEETGEAILFMPKGKSVRRRIAEPAEDPQALARTRRPDLFSPTDFTYTLTLLGKILPRNHNNGAPAAAPNTQNQVHKEEPKSITVKELLNQPTQANMFDWLKRVIGQ